MGLGSHSGDIREERWRVFCAIELPAHLRKRLMEHIATLRTLLPQVQAGWSREANLHLTLKFVGEIPVPSVTTFSAAIARAVENVSAFSLVIKGSGVFPKRRDPRVLWLGISDPEEGLAELHLRIQAETASVGFPKETRSFHPHVTLARLRNSHHAREVVQAHEDLIFEPEKIAVAELLIVRSELSGAGSKYSVISRHALR